MPSPNIPYDQRLARFIIRPFANTPLHPNHVTFLSLMLGLSAGLTFAFAGSGYVHLAAALFMTAVLVDHMDGELARLAGKTSTFGHYFDYLAGAGIYTFLFCGLGIGMYQWHGTEWGLWIGVGAGLSNFAIVLLRLLLERRHGAAAVEHASGGGFEIEDFIYLIGPITWLGGVHYFFWVYAVGTLAYLLWTVFELLRRETATRRGE